MLNALVRSFSAEIPAKTFKLKKLILTKFWSASCPLLLSACIRNVTQLACHAGLMHIALPATMIISFEINFSSIFFTSFQEV